MHQNKATKKEIKLPKSEEEIDEWSKEYPDVAAIVETIAMKKARETSANIEERLEKINAMSAEASKDKAEAELMKIHPDFNDIRDSDDFHEWADEQPKWVQDALYENDNDARSAARCTATRIFEFAVEFRFEIRCQIQMWVQNTDTKCQ